MDKYMSILARFTLFSLLFTFTTLAKNYHPIATDEGLPNIIKINPNFDGFKEYTNNEFHKYNKHESHTKDGSGSVELIGHHWKKALTSPAFKCEKNKKYTFSAYMKVSKFPKGQNITFGIIPRSIVQSSEVYWNSSIENKWEEVIIPFIATKDGECRFRVFTYTRAFNTEKEPKAVDENGTNLNRESKVFLDDVKVIESLSVLPRETIAKKSVFQSSFIKIDTLGNFFVKEEGKWKHIFPKMIYRNKEDQYRKYVEHGFNGIIDIWAKGQVEFGLKQGLKYFAMATQSDNGLEGTLTKRTNELIQYTYEIKKPYTFLMYMYDNQNKHIQDIKYHQELAKFVDKNDTDIETHKRARPIYYLNGQNGLARSSKNSQLNYMDITGTYIGASYESENKQLIPKETLGILYKTHNQIAPSPMIQLQAYLNEKFIPSLFYGIIQGGKAISVWRDGGSEGKFQDRVWAKSIKNVFKKIDKILPIIKEPHWTPWGATIVDNPYINIGTRNHNKNAYIIISNHAESDQNITVSLQDIKPKSIEDYYTKEKITNIVDNTFKINIGHGNNGYKVLKLIQ